MVRDRRDAPGGSGMDPEGYINNPTVDEPKQTGLAPTYAQTMSTERTSLRLTDERKRQLDKAKALLAADEVDDPPMSDVFDAALTHLLESRENMNEARGEYPPKEVADLMNTSVLKLHYRTSVDSEWR